MLVKFLIYIFSIITIFITPSCNKTFYNYEIQHLKSDENTETVKIYSFEKKESNAFEKARINAIKAILFKGIHNSQNTKPLIAEYGAEEKYKSYFNNFFKKNGKYLKFISLSSNSSEITKEGNKLKVGIIVTIQKDNLRKELEAANIIKALNNGF